MVTVLDRSVVAMHERLVELVRMLLARRHIARAVGNDDELTASGLSSIDLVDLMLAVEAEFAIKIPDADMTPANFRTIACIETLVTTLVSAPALASVG